MKTELGKKLAEIRQRIEKEKHLLNWDELEQELHDVQVFVKFPVSQELIDAAKKAGQEGVEIGYGRPVISIGMRKFLNCPLPLYRE